MNVWAVILAGGMGSRLAPISTAAKPKQFLDLTHSGQSLLQQTFFRACCFTRPENVLVVGNQMHEKLIKSQLAGLGEVVLEPEAKNTAASFFLAAQKIKRGMMVVMPADHYISGNFNMALIEAFMLANAGKIVTFGIKPTAPSSDYGYVGNGGFYEKPEPFVAKELINDGAHWNSGIYVAKAETILAEFKTHAPEFSGNSFAKYPKISFDKAIAEKSDKISMVKADFEWSDLGSFESLEKFKLTA